MVDNSLLGVIAALRKVQGELYASHKAYLLVTEQIRNLENYTEFINDKNVR